MKHRNLVSHLRKEGCVLHREGSKHSVFFNPETGHLAAIPRHRDIDIFLARKICRQLNIALPRSGA